jgi:hypothetical protein
VKTLVNEIVKLRSDRIWESYKAIEEHPVPDQHIKKWIQIIIKSLPMNPNQRQQDQGNNQQ